MKLSDLLNENAICTSLESTGKEQVIEELVRLLERAHGIKSGGEILDRVVEREAMMSTGIGNGVAIPHGKARCIHSLFAACGVAPKGLDFQSVDGEPVNLFILLVSPEEFRGPHVRTLANISRLLKEEETREGLKTCASPREFLEILKQAEATLL
ncbi:MAG: PTS sugar transporter subunit IIA [Candidatus Eiseniibacteriota bacterium]|nr:MAG: PTS sugar transporter subunit IIA [Candidatus Eisenbacteria bacterium]